MAVHFMDNVIEENKYPLPEVDKITKGNRKIGLGVMGFADMLYLMEIPYNSDDAIDLARQIMEFITTEGKKMSIELAKTRGVFPYYEGSIFSRNLTEDYQAGLIAEADYKTGLKIKGLPFDFADGSAPMPIRNATITTIAPTGTISIIAGCSSGIEPMFALSYRRENVLDNDKMVETNPLFEAIAKEKGFYSEEVMQKIADHGSCVGVSGVPEEIQKVYVTAHDISPEWHIKMQAAFQEFTDNAVSKTINLPKTATTEDIRKAYELAWDLGCKGITVYRDGSREKQVLNLGKAAEKKVPEAIKPADTVASAKRPRQPALHGITFRYESGRTKNKPYITLNHDVFENRKMMAELFIARGGGFIDQWTEAVGRLVSGIFRRCEDPTWVIDELRKVKDTNSAHQSPLFRKTVESDVAAIAEYINLYMDQNKIGPEYSDEPPVEVYSEGLNVKPPTSAVDQAVYEVCPDCGNKTLVNEEGCLKCHSCGYTHC